MMPAELTNIFSSNISPLYTVEFIPNTPDLFVRYMSTNPEEWVARMTQTASNAKQYAISLMEISIDLNFKHIYER